MRQGVRIKAVEDTLAVASITTGAASLSVLIVAPLGCIEDGAGKPLQRANDSESIGPVSSLISGCVDIPAQERIIFGEPAEAAVLHEAQRYGARRVFVLSTRSLRNAESGPLTRIERALGTRHVGTCTNIAAHSPFEDVIAATARARTAGADLLVAVGGGSVVDAAKAVQLCLGLRLESLEALAALVAVPSAAENARLDDAIRTVSVTTTLSAAEFTSIAGITNSRTGTKAIVKNRLLAPRSVVLDPAATLTTPAGLLLSTGIRAVDHAVETYCSPGAHPATEHLSLQGLHLLGQALPQIKRSLQNLEPRLKAQLGMWQAVGPVAAGVAVGASHGIGYVLGSGYGVAHGHTSCVMLPAVLQWNAAVNGERQRALSAALGAPGRAASELVAELVKGLGLPDSLRSVGIERADLDEIAQRALGYEWVRANPRPITRVEHIREILELAW